MSDHTQLLGKLDIELLALAPEATHQHKKGGLYRLIGRVMDCETGKPLQVRTSYGSLDNAVAYAHIYPHERQLWVRAESEFFDGRFRQLSGAQMRNT